MMPKVNNADMAGIMESIEEYLRSCCGVIRATLAYVIKKAITILTYGDYPKYVIPDNKMIAMMLHLPQDKNKLQNEQSAQSVKEHMAEHEVINNRHVYNILDQIYKDTDLYQYDNQHKSKRDERGAFYAIHSRWLVLQHQKLRWHFRHLHMMEKRRPGTGKSMLLTCQVPYYPGKPYETWLSRS